MPIAPPLTAADLRQLPVEQCALRLLRTLVKTRWPGPIHRRDVVFADAVLAAAGPPAGRVQYGTREPLEQHLDLSFAVSEAWAWLVSHDLLARSPLPDPQYPKQDAYAVTRLGYDLLRHDKPLDHLNARRRLGLELHESIAADLAPLVAVGAFDSAAFKALRTVEETVRRLAGDPRSSSGGRLVGRPLMQHAFRTDGPLANPEAEPAEQQGLMELYAGAFGAIRNPLNHTSVAWSDPTAAAEVVLIADFLLRQLDVVATRLVTGGPAVDA